ncbi:DapH/DapD/GlmU-related protein [Agarivorans sp. B2Z047]
MWIGGNVVVCQGVTIGARSVVAAGSVVTKNVEPDSLVGGMPAKRIRALV